MANELSKALAEVAVETSLSRELLAQGGLVVSVYGHDASGAKILAAQDRTGPGGPPVAGIAPPDMPPGKLGF